MAEPGTGSPVVPAGAGEPRRTSPIELLWDLVFVFAITQVTTLLSRHPDWTGLGQAMLVLALVWWAWSAFVWAANAQDPNAATLRACLLLGSLCIFITGLALPRAFGADATVFACSYALVRLLHLALYVDASRRGHASFAAIAGFGVTVLTGMALLVAGALLSGAARTVLWIAAVAIDYAGPAWLTRERLRGLQEVAVAHFAERYGLFVIICLGESIVAIGLSAARRPLSLALVAAVSLGLLIAIGLWWTYFDRTAAAAEQRLRGHRDAVLAAADGYSYLHLVIVAGIILFAVGVKLLAAGAVGGPLDAAARLALCGGVSVYLVGHVGFGLRILGELAYAKALSAIALLVLFALSGALPAWTVAAAVALVLGALCLYETTAAPEASLEPHSELRAAR